MDAPSHRIVGFQGGAATPPARPFHPRFVLRLQQTVGNREVTRLLTWTAPPSMALVPSPSRVPEAPRQDSRTARVTAWCRRLWRRPA